MEYKNYERSQNQADIQCIDPISTYMTLFYGNLELVMLCEV